MNSQDAPQVAHQTPSGRLWLTGALVLFFILWIPGTVLFLLISEYEQKQEELTLNERSERAEEVLSQMERLLDVDLLVSHGLEKFWGRCQQEMKGTFPPEATLLELEKQFFSYFPRRSTLIWFDQQHQIKRFHGSSDLGKFRRGWISLAKYLTAKDPTTADEQMAGRMVKLLVSPILPPNVLRSAATLPLLLYFGGELHTFRYYHTPTGGALIFVPAEGTRRDWEISRAVRALGRLQDQFPLRIGGFRQSSETLIASGDISPNLVVGFRGKKVEGVMNAYEDGFLYRGHFFPADPDVFLIAGVGQRQGSGIFGLPAGFLLKCLLGILGLLLTIGTGFLLSGYFPLVLTLRTKFAGIVGLLAAIPFLALLVIGLTHSVKFAIQQREDKVQLLENLLTRVELAAAEEIGRLESEFQALVKRPELAKGGYEAVLRDYFRRNKDTYGISHIYFFQKSANPLCIGGTQIDPLSQAVAKTLRLKSNAGEAPIKGDDSSMFLGFFTLDNFLSSMGRIMNIDVGSTRRFFFHSLILGPNRTRRAYIFISSRFEAFQAYLLKRSGEKVKETSDQEDLHILLRPRTPPEKSGRTPGGRNSLDGIVDLVDYTGQALKTFLTVNGREFQVWAKPLQELHAVGLVALPTVGRERQGRWFGLAGLLTMILAAGFAVFAAHLLREFLLQPLLSLKEAMNRVIHGDYALPASAVSTDELGDLLTDFTHLTDGLRQKERMSQFVRDDLLTTENQTIEAGTTREVVILFAGIRDFSHLEPQLSPRAAMAIMSHFLGVCEEQVKAHGGKVDKFIGDTVLAVFSGESPAGDAVAATGAALAITADLEGWNQERRQLGLPLISHGIGLSQGPAIIGHVGSTRKRLDFTVIGDTVNTAARVEKMAGRGEQGRILVTHNLQPYLEGRFGLRETDIRNVRGKQEIIKVFQVNEQK